ncbi:MAG: ABC transporter ATP-binding protein/permease [Bacillales bacterium]|nr:ABC transporter ATP-binding protein/permease [Bacillales bacterium]
MDKILTVKRLIKKYWLRISFIIFLTLLSSFLNAVPLTILKSLIDDVVEYTKNTPDMADIKKLIPLALLYIGLQTLGIFINSLGRLVNSSTQSTIQHNIRLDIYKHVSTLQQGFFDDLNSIELLNKLIQDTDIIVAGILSPLINLSSAIFSFGFGFFFMWSINPTLTLIILPFALIVGLITKLSGGRYRMFAKENRARNQKMWNRYNENIRGMKEIHASLQEEYQFNQVETTSALVKSNVIHTSKYHFWIEVINGVSLIVIVAIMLGVGGYLIGIGKATVGTVMAIFTYKNMLTAPVQYVIAMFIDLYKLRISMERVNVIMQEKEDTSYNYNIQNILEIPEAIVLDNVNFHYKDHQMLFDNLSLTIAKGETTAIVGSTGSGKSSILKLIEGLYTLDSGSIKVFGKELNEENKLSIRNLMSISFQDTFLFDASLRENILFANVNIAEEELNEIIEHSLVSEMLPKLPNGLDTMIGENGVKLSGGEKQRVGIARALLRKPKILLLDEATSALDNNTEKQIVENIKKYYQDTTCVIVAHRLHTIEHSDKIVVLEKGKIVEMGNHQELLNKGGLYSKLYSISNE